MTREPRRRSWPGRITFSLLGLAGALFIGAVVWCYEYARVWTPLERVYGRSYVEASIVALSPLHQAERFNVLVLGSGHLAEQADVDAGKSVRWSTVALSEDLWCAWLRDHVFEGNSAPGLLAPALWGSLAGLLVLLPLGIRKDLQRYKQRRSGSIALRGTGLVSRTEFHRRTVGNTGIGWATEGGPSLWENMALPAAERKLVRIARADEQEHILMVGDSGSGKSSLIRQVLRQLEERGEPAIVYDPAMEYVPEFFRPKRGDWLLNPYDGRMPYWSPAEDEVTNEAEADALSTSLFPERAGDPNPFFIESARKIFAHLLKESVPPSELYRWIQQANPEIDNLVRGTELEPIITQKAQQQRAGVLAVLERAGAALRLLPQQAARRWSATDWAKESNGSWIFITSTHKSRQTLRPLVSMWIDQLMLQLLDRPLEVRKPVWVVMDEISSLQRLPTLPKALAEARKSNTRLVLGVQNAAQLEYEYGLLWASMLSQARTKFFLRTSEARGAQWASDCLGQVEAEKVHESKSVGELGLLHRRNLSHERRIEPAVFAGEIIALDRHEGYLQMPGLTMRLRFTYCEPRLVQPAFVPGEVASPVRAVESREDPQTEPVDEPDFLSLWHEQENAQAW